MRGGRRREPALLVTLDLVGVQDAVARTMAGRIAHATGVPASRILLACSHTHYAPTVGLQRIIIRTWDGTASSTRTPPTSAR